jgi:hypothetical protein
MGTVDIYWHDTMYVVSYRVLAVGSLVLGALIAAVVFVGWLLAGKR